MFNGKSFWSNLARYSRNLHSKKVNKPCETMNIHHEYQNFSRFIQTLLSFGECHYRNFIVKNVATYPKKTKQP